MLGIPMSCDFVSGESTLLKLVYEEEAYDPEVDDCPLPSNPCVWRHRPRITVDHFFRQFHLLVETDRRQPGAFPVIRLFKTQVHLGFFRLQCLQISVVLIVGSGENHKINVNLFLIF
jgi:hypothetical protein